MYGETRLLTNSVITNKYFSTIIYYTIKPGYNEKKIWMKQDLNPQPLPLCQIICFHPNFQISAVDSTCQYKFSYQFFLVAKWERQVATYVRLILVMIT